MERPATVCRGRTVEGRHCARLTRANHGFCWQHEAQRQRAAAAPQLIPLNHIVPVVRRGGRVQNRRRAAPLLRNLAADGQNAHDRRMYSPSLPMLHRLLNKPVPHTQDTLAIVDTRLREHYGRNHRRTWIEWMCCIPLIYLRLAPEQLQVYHHICYLYNLPIAANRVTAFQNKSFHELLDHATAFIESKPQAADIWARVFDEMADGIGYCLHGNVARLLNAFGGFYDDAAVVDNSDILQSRMAVIAANTQSVAEKVAEARVLLTELNIPETAWAPWLTALEE